jgi:hypothetical protein
MTSRFFALTFAFWVAFALIMIVAFNYRSSLPSVMGVPGGTVIAVGLNVAVWIAVGVYIAIKRKPDA